MGLRRNSREWALQFLFQHEFEENNQQQTHSLNNQLNKFNKYFEPQVKEWEFAKELISGVIADTESLDQQISNKLENWKLSRIAKIDHLLLRLGAFEITSQMTPYAVVLNEILEIAKKYSSTDSHTFINGVLDKIAGDTQK